MIRKFISYYKPYKALFYLDLVAALMVAGINLLMPIFTRQILNVWISERNLKVIVFICLGMLLCYGIKIALNYFMAYQGHMMAANMQADMRRDLFAKFEKLPCKYYDNHKTGELMSRMTSDLFDVSELAHHGPEDLFISVIQLLGAAIILGNIHFLLTLICFLVLIPMIVIVTKTRHRMSKAAKDSKVRIASLNAGLENSISGVKVTKAFNAKEKEEENFQKNNLHYVEARRDFCKAMGIFASSMDFGTDFLSLVILLVGALLIFYTNHLSNIDLVTFMLYISVFLQPIRKMVNFMEQYENGMTGFVRFQEILKEDEELDEPGAKEAPQLKGDILFNNISFTYDGKTEVLHDLTLQIEAGKTVALVGSSGGGKTTICHLLPRFYEVQSGDIYLDGTNIKEYTRESIRKQIGIVSQDVFLFDATIFENIAYGEKGITKEMVVSAARYAQLDDFVQTLSEGYETQVGERGVKLSGGQKQRVAIARAFLKNPPILILDEATSALDNITEQEIQNSLQKLSKGRTTIVVAHRLTTVRNADLIVYIEDGRVIEMGTHEELMNFGGEYSKLIMASEQIKKTEGLLSH